MMDRLIIVVAAVAVAVAVYVWLRWRDGRVVAVREDIYLGPEELGHPLGFHATLVQFSTPMCSRCPGTARLLASLTADDPRLSHVDIDATERLDLANRFEIMRTPTVLILAGNGRVVARMSGTLTGTQVRDALDSVESTGTDYAI